MVFVNHISFTQFKSCRLNHEIMKKNISNLLGDFWLKEKELVLRKFCLNFGEVH